MASRSRRAPARRKAPARRSYSTPRRSSVRRPARRAGRTSGKTQTVRIVLQTAGAPRLGDASVGAVRSGRAKF